MIYNNSSSRARLSFSRRCLSFRLGQGDPRVLYTSRTATWRGRRSYDASPYIIRYYFRMFHRFASGCQRRDVALMKSPSRQPLRDGIPPLLFVRRATVTSAAAARFIADNNCVLRERFSSLRARLRPDRRNFALYKCPSRDKRRLLRSMIRGEPRARGARAPYRTWYLLNDFVEASFPPLLRRHRAYTRSFPISRDRAYVIRYRNARFTSDNEERSL